MFFFQGERGFQEKLNSFSGDLKELFRTDDIVNLLRGDIQEFTNTGTFSSFPLRCNQRILSIKLTASIENQRSGIFQ